MLSILIDVFAFIRVHQPLSAFNFIPFIPFSTKKDEPESSPYC